MQSQIDMCTLYSPKCNVITENRKNEDDDSGGGGDGGSGGGSSSISNSNGHWCQHKIM